MRWLIAAPPIVAGALLAADSHRRWRTYEDAMQRGRPLVTGRALSAPAIAIAAYGTIVLVAPLVD